MFFSSFSTNRIFYNEMIHLNHLYSLKINIGLGIVNFKMNDSMMKFIKNLFLFIILSININFNWVDQIYCVSVFSFFISTSFTFSFSFTGVSTSNPYTRFLSSCSRFSIRVTSVRIQFHMVLYCSLQPLRLNRMTITQWFFAYSQWRSSSTTDNTATHTPYPYRSAMQQYWWLY